MPGLYTYAGFQVFFIPQLAAVADKIEGEKWVMGELAEQEGIEEQFGQLGPVLIERYGKDFVDAWNAVLDNPPKLEIDVGRQAAICFALSGIVAQLRRLRQFFEACSPGNPAYARSRRRGELAGDLRAKLLDDQRGRRRRRPDHRQICRRSRRRARLPGWRASASSWR